ncbi:MAG: hypothetical protein AAGF97_18970 [Planctomycetota bacterium]
MLTVSETRVLNKFREFQMNPNEMLCFYGPDLKAKKAALNSLVEKQLLLREKFAGAYSLTRAGYESMRRAT